MSGNEEILPALSRERECGWCCYSRGIASPLKSHLNKDLKGSFWFWGKKYPGIRSAPGTPGVPGKAWRPCGQGRVSERESWSLEMRSFIEPYVRGFLVAPKVEEPLNPQSSFIFWRSKQ